MKALLAALAMLGATSASAAIIDYKAVFPASKTIWYDDPPFFSNVTSAPSPYRGAFSVEWSIDTSRPDLIVDDRLTVWGWRGWSGTGPRFVNLICNGGGADATGLGCSSGWDGPGDLFEGGFGSSFGLFSSPPTAKELDSQGMFFFGEVFGPGGGPFTDFGFEAESAWVTTAPVPVPAALPLLAAGLLGLGFVSRPRSRRKNC